MWAVRPLQRAASDVRMRLMHGWLFLLSAMPGGSYDQCQLPKG